MRPLDIVVLGLSLSSSWGNGHATTWRALLKGLHGLGHRVTFLERDKPWYAAHRDLPDPAFCRLDLYDRTQDLRDTHLQLIRTADLVLVGSYVPDGKQVIELVLAAASGRVAFYDIDTPVTLAALEDGDCPYLDAGQIPRLDLYLSFTGGPILARLRDAWGARRPETFHCAVDETLYRPVRTEIRWDLGYLGTYSPDRQPALERLLVEPARRLPGHRFVVAGPQYPPDIDWPANVERIEHLAPDLHPAFYAAQRWTLNVTRADMIETGFSPSVRLFEAAACGTPIVSDPWPGLNDLLPGAVLTADTADAIARLLTEGDDVRERQAAAARALVLAHHTGTARARSLERLVISGDARASAHGTP